MPVPLTRRALLVGLVAAGATAACTGPSAEPSPTPLRPTVDQLARQAAITRERELSGLAAAALDAYPTMTLAATAITFHTKHVLALSETLTPSPSPTSTPTGSATQSPTLVSPQPSPSRQTGTRASTAHSLAGALLDAGDAHRAAAAGVSNDLARLLASLAASDAALAAALQAS